MTLEYLWGQYKNNGSKEAKDALIVHYVELVKIIAGRLYSTYNARVEFDDLQGYGILGLIDAIEKFDLSKQIKFETYANIRIRGAIIDEIRHMDWIPRSTRQKYKRVEEAVERLQLAHGNEFSDADVAEELDLSLEDYGKLMGEVTTYAIVSLEEKIEGNSNFDIASDYEGFDPEGHFMKGEMRTTLIETIEGLPEKEKTVMQLYYYSELTYKEIASVLSVSESRVSQIHTKAISKLRISLKHLV